MNYQVLADDDLVRECAEHPCPEVWEEFIRRFRKVIATVASRACREWSETAPDVVEDRIQDTFLKLCDDDCSLLRKFQSRHPGAILGFLRSVTASVVYDHFRAEHARKRDVDNTTELNEGIYQLAHRAGSMSPADLEIFLNEINDLLLQRGNGPVEERDRTIFWLHHRGGLTAKEIASIKCLNLTVKGVNLGIKGVESVLHRLLLYVKEALVTEEVKKG
ncbi:MAG TPA: sigma-70 family RNA polymerase sigma factor [Candidatus Angelobacter sp.]